MKRVCDKTGSLPGDEQIKAYIGGWTETRISGLKTEADQILSGFLEYVISEQRPKIVEEALKERSFVRDAFVAFCGAAIYTLILIAAGFILKFFGIDLLDIFKKIAS